ncbi:MAG: hypothetical protein V3V01_05000 [Acidimicrobiales bacterium]
MNERTVGGAVRIENQGGSLEGHTPRGFAGSGTGLFAGDNLNANFPEGEGVQIWLTFELPEGTAVPETALLTSNALSESGSPFTDLGALQAELVSYESFGPPLFDLVAEAPAVTCERVEVSGLSCDVSASARAAIEAGRSTVQYRLKFETVADGDGQQDLALFFLSDSNTNEPGIFALELT